MQYSKTLRAAPLNEVAKKHEEALVLYEGIENLKGNPNPLKRKIESYVSAVKDHLALEEVASKCQRSEQAKDKIFLRTQALKKAELDYAEIETERLVLLREQSSNKLQIMKLETKLE